MSCFSHFHSNKIEDVENDIEILEQKLERVVKQCSLVIESGKNYVAQQW